MYVALTYHILIDLNSHINDQQQFAKYRFVWG
jgi:hypothetical protein